VRPLSLELSPRGISGQIQLTSGLAQLESRLLGAPNVENLLTSLAIVEALGYDAREVAARLVDAPPIPGRFERCDLSTDDLTVLVDYAHTPDALERLLEAVRATGATRVTTVFGCGGDRDAKKRPLMGAIAARLSERAIVTNDNPRTERPELIADAVLSGVHNEGRSAEVILDRRTAIFRAISEARPGETVVIAGKGHEDYQIFGTEHVHFDDRDEARGALSERRSKLSSEQGSAD
jgi:UDP-N-acetylmuramoyl-L-alanyl-D-glutamate--2,6-diaminopimelate ligase